MKKLNKIQEELVDFINKSKRDQDLSDLGNTIGIVIGKHIKKKKMGYTKDDFLSGLEHGFSLVDGSHDKPLTYNEARDVEDKMGF